MIMYNNLFILILSCFVFSFIYIVFKMDCILFCIFCIVVVLCVVSFVSNRKGVKMFLFVKYVSDIILYIKILC